MKLRALDQIHVSAVQSDSLRPGQEFEVSDELGSQLLTRHPAKFRQISKPAAAPKPRRMPKPKAKKATAKPKAAPTDPGLVAAKAARAPAPPKASAAKAAPTAQNKAEPPLANKAEEKVTTKAE